MCGTALRASEFILRRFGVGLCSCDDIVEIYVQRAGASGAVTALAEDGDARMRQDAGEALGVCDGGDGNG